MPGRVSQVATEVLRGPLGARTSQAAVEVLRTAFVGAHASQIAVEGLRTNSVGSRVSQAAVEVLRSTSGARVTQVSLEALRGNASGARTSQLTTEVLRTFTCGARASQVSAEVLRSDVHGARASQAAVEILWAHLVGARATQAAVEVLRETEGLPSRVTQLVAEVLRPGDGLARVTQGVGEVLRTGDGLARMTAAVAEVLRTNAPIEYPSDSIAHPWPFRANAKFELTERYGYLSEVLRASNGAEQRRLLRETAGGSVSFTCTLLTARELQYAAALLGALIGQEISVPLWQYQQRLIVACAAGSIEIPAETATIPFYPEAPVLLWRSPWAWEVFQVLNVGASSLTAIHELQQTWPAHETLILPLVSGYLDERAEQMKHSIQAGDHPMDFDVPAFFPRAGEAPPPGTQYLGYDVLELLPNRPGPVPEGVSRAHEVLDSRTGTRWTDVLEAAAVGDRPFHWPCLGRAAALAQRMWLDARHGMVTPFWVPTREPDLNLAGDAFLGAEQIVIQRVEYSGLLWAGSNARRHLIVYARGAAPSYHYVSAASDPGEGDTETLTITPPLPVDWPAATTKLSFLRFCRLREAFVDRRWIGGGFCDAEIPYVEIPKEAPAP